VVLGDLNGRVESRQEDWEIVGRYGEEVINVDRNSFLELCKGADMIIKKVPKMTFVQRMVIKKLA
jgi:hypothetical protein